MLFCTNYLLFFVEISSSYRPGAFNRTTNFDVDDDFYPIEEINNIQTNFVNADPGSWIRKYTVVLETQDGRRTFTLENPQQKVHAGENGRMKVVPETAV